MMTYYFNALNKIAPLIIILLFGFSACKKNQTRYEPFTVLWQKSLYMGGCGYVLVSSNKKFFPTNLPSEFMVDSLKVLVDLRFANDFFVCNNETESLIKVDVEGIKLNL